ncbi:ADP-ribosylglycohydrolase family protein [Stratiformator vulcanicus]|uniref:ADP-ribosyl-[dinitrogen reductase] glycohydrolase n=1 Tax=Stratiformator vulcanicus TaxID=2527980 RepID=A0A517R7L6_9PLAN|nr:ADP-ribosylglycohydrolase family protein [Stratiformator vulcanicus]QDT39880.1 ADP-ribosyl-[dinitrogen reductase] glycohydrolase [Stratiformator vulcanicus]
MPPQHRLPNLRRSLNGLATGDAFGQQFFYFPEFIHQRELPVGPWEFTDDTVMALAICHVLARRGEIDQEELAREFAERWREEPGRGYGSGASQLLRAIADAGNWRTLSRESFGGQGSFGNGAAMRVAPLGAYFADDLDRVVEEADRSAEVTHAHPEGRAAAIAVAVAAAVFANRDETDPADFRESLFHEVLIRTPDGDVRAGIVTARDLSAKVSIGRAATVLGNGDQITAPDTVPLCLWLAARHAYDFEEALWQTISALGDRDTNCAIVGGIIASQPNPPPIPDRWLVERESLPGVG